MKRYPEKIDLHMHSTVSDGTDTPERLLALAREHGFGLISVTDHDGINGAKAVLALLKKGDPLFLPGVEFSCRDEKGKYHILGYGYEPNGESLLYTLRKSHSYRGTKARARLSYLKNQYGFAFPSEEVDRLMSLDNPGKPHIGNLMVKYGYAASKEEAIVRYIDRCSVAGCSLRPEEAIWGILGSGGIPVLAHPFFGGGRDMITGEDMEERLRRMIGFGLQGVEAFYSGFSQELSDEMVRLADKYDLYITAGSDYHGSNKTVLPGDTHLGDSGSYPDGLKRFLERADCTL